MSDDAWDADGYQPTVSAGVTDKWEGEDEDEDVKDDWDADSDEDKSKTESARTADKPNAGTELKKKKKLRDRIALLEAQGNEDSEEGKDLSPEDKLAEKLRLQKLEEETQLALTMDMLGLKTGSIDSMVPSTNEDFDAFGKAICEKVRLFSSSEHYVDLLEFIVKDLTLDMQLPTLKKVKIHMEGLHSARLKEEKSSKSKKKLGKSSLKNDLDKDLFSGGGGEQFEDMDDFM